MKSRSGSAKKEKLEEPKQTEPERIEPELALTDAEKATEEEQREFVKRFVVAYLAKNGETADEFFAHWIQHRYPEIDQELIRKTVAVMIRSNAKKSPIRVSRIDRVDGVQFLVLAQ